MPATRLSVPIVSAMTCAIFLLSFAGCTSDINKIKEDAYKQGYEQGVKDKSKTQAPSTNYADDYFKQLSLERKRLYQEYLQKQAEEAEQLMQWQKQREIEQQLQQLEDEIRQLESDLDFERSKHDSSTRDSELWEYEYYKNH
jgi:flagellar motility protein MotE (MotC chaperone)